MRLSEPWILLLWVAVVPFVWWRWKNSLADLGPTRRITSLVVRLALLLAVAIGLAGVGFRGTSDELAVAFLVDRSRSLDEAAQDEARAYLESAQASRPSGTQATVIEFAGDVSTRVPLGVSELRLPEEAALENRDASDLQGGLQVAAAVLPATAERRIVVLSDGKVTGVGQSEELAAAAGGAGVDAFVLQGASGAEVAVSRMDFPAGVEAGAPFDASVEIFSDGARPATVRIYQDQLLVREESINLEEGANSLTLEDLRGGDGFAAFEVHVESPEDRVLQNNVGRSVVASSGRPQVLIIDPEPENVSAFSEAIRNEGFEVDVRPPDGFPRDSAELRNFDLVVLSDTPILELDDRSLDDLRRWVHEEGGGFLMAGGQGSFGAGGFRGAAVEKLLPVSFENQDRIDSPVAALMVILDRSGSMAAMVEGRTKMSLADEGAVQALELLQPKDLFGLNAVDTRTHVVAPLSKAINKAETADRIRQVTSSGGGIYTFTAMADAFRSLRDSEAAIKHIILFADAADAEEKATDAGSALDLASAMLGSRITTSVVALGREKDSDVEFLRSLSERGGGRFYLTDNALNLPRLFSIEAMRATQSSAVERPFFASAAAPSDLTTGVSWPESPLLLGFNKTELKPGADLLLQTEDGYPLLAVWRSGLGRAAAFTSDIKNRWGSEWQTWPEAGKFWSQLARGLARPQESGKLTSVVEPRGDRLALRVEAASPDGTALDGLDLQVVTDQEETEVLRQVGPGVYETEFPSSEALLATVVDRETGKTARVAWSTATDAEFRIGDGAKALEGLVAIAGGQVNSDPAAVWRRAGSAVTGWRDLSPWFFALAIILLPIDIAIRRWPVREFAVAA